MRTWIKNKQRVKMKKKEARKVVRGHCRRLRVQQKEKRIKKLRKTKVML
jgi:hypothetical protein